jgi:hypothetical protein
MIAGVAAKSGRALNVGSSMSGLPAAFNPGPSESA